MCCFFLLLTGCPASDPAHPSGGVGIDGSQLLGDGEIDEIDEPLVEMFDLPPDYLDPPIERTGAWIQEGSATLAGSQNLTGESSPLVRNFSYEFNEVEFVHLKATASGGQADWLFVEVAYEGVTDPFVYQIPANGAWQYRVFMRNGPGSVQVRIHNRPTLNGELNPGAVTVSYFLKTQDKSGSFEPNDDENPATISDYTDARTITTGDVAIQSVYRRPDNPTDRDLEDWYFVPQSSSTNPLDRLLTFSTYGQRYTPTRYRITFYAVTKPYSSFSSTKLIRAGLPFYLTELTAGKTFQLSHKHRFGYYVQIVATPLAPAPGSNFQYQVHSMNPWHRTGIHYIKGEGIGAGLAGDFDVRPFEAMNYNALSIAWDFGGGATCLSRCDEDLPNLTLGAAGTYTGRLDITMAGNLTDSREFQYTIGSIDPGWSFPASQQMPNNIRTPVLLADASFTHIVYLNNDVDQLQHGQFNDAGLTNVTTVLRGPIKMARRSAIIHRGRIFIAYVDAQSKFLFLLVSKNLQPLSENDWTQYSLADGVSTSFQLQLAEVGSQLALTYGATEASTNVMFVRSLTAEPLSATDWERSELVPGVPLEQTALLGHAGRWWAATLSDAGLLRLGYAQTLQPHGGSDWTWMELDTQGEPGNGREGKVRLLTVGDRLAIGYSRNEPDEITSFIGISDHPAPFHVGHFRWTRVDSPLLQKRLPGIALATDQTHIFSFTAENTLYTGDLSWGELPQSGQPVRLVRKQVLDLSSSMIYSTCEMAYEKDSHALVVVWMHSSSDLSFYLQRIQL